MVETPPSRSTAPLAGQLPPAPTGANALPADPGSAANSRPAYGTAGGQVAGGAHEYGPKRSGGAKSGCVIAVLLVPLFLCVGGAALVYGLGPWLETERSLGDPYGGMGPVVAPGEAPGPTMPPPAQPVRPVGTLALLGAPVRFMVTVVRATGAAMAPPPTECVLVIDQPSVARCQARFTCDGKVLYGGDGLGYFDCPRDQDDQTIVGRDDNTSEGDGDGAIDIDSRSGIVTLRDDAAGTYGELEVEGRFDPLIVFDGRFDPQ